MKKLLLLTCALLALSASLASAQVGLNLGWTSCGDAASQLNRAFACDENALTHNLVASYVPALGTTDFAGVSGLIDIAFGGPTPPWWDYEVCRAGAMGMIPVGNLGFCTNNPYAAAGLQGGGIVGNSTISPSRRRVQADWSRSEPGTVVAGARNSGFVIQFSSDKTIDEGFGVCAGCSDAACLVINRLEIYTFTGGLTESIETQNTHQGTAWQGGAVGGQGCPAETPAKSTTWGSVKALYR